MKLLEVIVVWTVSVFFSAILPLLLLPIRISCENTTPEANRRTAKSAMFDAPSHDTLIYRGRYVPTGVVFCVGN